MGDIFIFFSVCLHIYLLSYESCIAISQEEQATVCFSQVLTVLDWNCLSFSVIVHHWLIELWLSIAYAYIYKHCTWKGSCFLFHLMVMDEHLMAHVIWGCSDFPWALVRERIICEFPNALASIITKVTGRLSFKSLVFQQNLWVDFPSLSSWLNVTDMSQHARPSS